MMTIAQLYHEACKTPSDINEHLPTFVDLCLKLQAEQIIELGTRGGVSTIAWLYGLEESDGHLWSIDLDPAPGLPTERWTFWQGDDLDPTIYTRLPRDVDIVFIDTSHMYRDTLAELHAYKRKVRSGGKIVLHDTELAIPEGWTKDQPRYPVRTAVKEFCAEEQLDVTFVPHNNGLGVISIG